MPQSILITGASRGLGQHMARHFAARGYRLALTARKLEDLEALIAELAPKADRVIARQLDVCDYDAIEGVLRDCARNLDGLDIVVINAGVAMPTPVGTGHFDQIRQTLDVNLTAAIATSEAAVTIFREQGGGQIVGVSSIAAVRGLRGQSAYCASKAGFSRYLESLRCETLDDGIAVTELAPGFIDTDLNRSVEKRPFLVTAERGTRIMADLIERRVGHRYVPRWPWTLVAQWLKRAPNRAIARM